MRSAIQISALLIALGGCLGLVTAQHHTATSDETIGLGISHAAIVDDYEAETEITGSINLASVPRLELSEEQRGFIFLGLINLPDVPELAVKAPEAGVPLPQTVELQEIPAMVVRRIPEISGYKFVKLDDRILLVSAQTRQVDSMIPRYKLVFH
jgi:hypothetical protein